MEGPEASEKTKNDPEKDNPLRKFGLFAVIVTDFFGYTLAGVGIGYYAWTRWGAPGWIVLVTSLLGLVLAFYKLIKMDQNGNQKSRD